MVFVARQMVEKCREHNDSFFVLFVDLQKAYDSITQDGFVDSAREIWCTTYHA